MTDHKVHSDHNHVHGKNCGHTAIEHDGHTDYLHDGHLHHVHDGHIDEHTLSVNGQSCTSGHECSSHEASHSHNNNCGHEAVPHSDHTDYLVDGHLHHNHAGHCDDHGKVKVS